MASLTQEQIAASIFTHWSAQYPLAVTTVYPGMKVETTSLGDWLELRIDTWSKPPQRAAANQLLELALTVECFVKPGLHKGRIHVLADRAKSTIAQQAITVHDYETAGDPVIGCVRFFEAEVLDLSRHEASTLQHALQHQRLVCPGVAEPI